ncbi:hypothetical protein [Nocardia abscessus]|uniref:hypothetical protein n=1 Tax=Nocardia abscessus TaxID=120957 RepID=UPI002454DA4A|nr:hypothetical protein [Nocardia abscessus]
MAGRQLFLATVARGLGTEQQCADGPCRGGGSGNEQAAWTYRPASEQLTQSWSLDDAQQRRCGYHCHADDDRVGRSQHRGFAQLRTDDAQQGDVASPLDAGLRRRSAAWNRSRL